MPGWVRPRLLACALLALFVTLTPAVWAQEGNIFGEIRVARGDFPSERVKVTIRTRGIIVDTVYADDLGRFSFVNLPGNPYMISIQEEGYRAVEERVVLNPSTQINQFVFLNLEPLPTKQSEGPPGGVPGGNPNVVNVTDFLNRYPKEVRKEYDRGVQAEKHGKTDEAIERYRKVVQMAPDFYFARNNLGSLLVARQEFQAAQEQFEEVIRISQNDAAGYLNLGNVYLLTGRYDEARQTVEQGLSKQPDHAFGHFVLGSVYCRTGRLPDAERELREALRLDPLLSKPHLEIVNLYMRQKRVPDAIKELQTFLQAFPQDPMAPQARQVLARLEATPALP